MKNLDDLGKAMERDVAECLREMATPEFQEKMKRYYRGQDDPTDMGYWFPRLVASGVRVPRTILVPTDCELASLWDNEEPDGFQEFVEKIETAAQEIGYPIFLRTGFTSGKHSFRDCCYVEKSDMLVRHIYNLVQDSGLKDIAFGTWAIREFLQLDSSFKAFRGFPVNRERRYFIEGGKVLCHHFYWPEHSIEGHTDEPEWRSKLALLNEETKDEVALLTQLSERVSQEFDGAWSLDWARAKDGTWYAIDMAEAHVSFHAEHETPTKGD